MTINRRDFIRAVHLGAWGLAAPAAYSKPSNVSPLVAVRVSDAIEGCKFARQVYDAIPYRVRYVEMISPLRMVRSIFAIEGDRLDIALKSNIICAPFGDSLEQAAACVATMIIRNWEFEEHEKMVRMNDEWLRNVVGIQREYTIACDIMSGAKMLSIPVAFAFDYGKGELAYNGQPA